MLRTLWCCVMLSCALLPRAAYPDTPELLGANAALQRLAGTKPAPGAAKADEIATLLADLDSFAAKPGAPAAAAATWVSLYARWDQVRAKVDRSKPDHYDKTLHEPMSTQSLMARLPPPEAWPELEKLLRKRYRNNGGLDVLGALLTRDAVPEALERARGKISQLSQSQRAAGERDVATIKRLAITGDDPSSLLKAFELDLDEKAALSGGGSRIEVPDLVTMVGQEEARVLLTKAVLLPTTSVSVPVGDQTRALAQQILIEKTAQLRVPHWGLVRAPKAKEVYEALATQFPKAADSTDSFDDAVSGSESYDDVDFGALYTATEERSEAQLHYLIGLIVAGEASKAEALASRLSSSNGLARASNALSELRQQGYSPQLYAFFKALLGKTPTLSAWPVLFDLAAENGKSDEALAMVERALKNPALSPVARRELRHQRVNALLAGDKVKAAIDDIDRLATAADNQGDQLISFRTELALQLMEVGHLQQDKKAVDRGSARAKQEFRGTWPEEQAYERYGFLLKFVKQLRGDRRLGEAERVLLEELDRARAKGNAEMMSAFAMVDPAQQALTVELVGVYHQAERWQDVLALTDGLPQWGAEDLAAIALVNDSSKVPLGHMVGQALVKRGDVDRARPILEAVMSLQGGFDPAYEAYVESLGPAAIPFLEQTYARDQFEERPLIWKAVALVKAGKADEAEAAARQAISVDPSDGEQGAGHRMRAYAILADALAQRGQLEAAESYRGAIRAIRMSEHADEFRSGGMHARAIALYREALGQFDDAYCIQSRLAIELAHSGRVQEAEQHYRRAYELMPSSFGRVESHCFGCEKAFETQQAQGLAEQVFKDLLRKSPEKAQVHYLMGYLRFEQARPAEALAFFREAVAIDAEYLNAWKKLYEVGQRVHMGRGERDVITLKILRLDPQLRHSSPDLDDVVDLVALWRAVSVAKALQAPAPTKLLPLSASAASRKDALSQLPEAMRRQMTGRLELMSDYGQQGVRRMSDPGVVLANTKLLASVTRLIDQGTAPPSY